MGTLLLEICRDIDFPVKSKSITGKLSMVVSKMFSYQRLRRFVLRSKT